MVDPGEELECGRTACLNLAWAEAHRALSAADRSRPLDPPDLELLATAAFMEGREPEYLKTLERAHEGWFEKGDRPAAVRCAFWIGVTLARKGDMGQAGGWLGRGHRLLEGEPADCAERGYLLMPRVFEQEAKSELELAAETAGQAAAIGQKFGDADLFALAAHTRGHVLIRSGQLSEGLGLLDEAMVELSRGELSPIVSGIVYCGVILACREAHEVGRAGEWTDALSEWCERQPEMVAFTGRCRVHRAEIMHLRGDWAKGLDEARRARERGLTSGNSEAAGEACYRRGEIYRQSGEPDAAEAAYREASQRGREPQPGLALLRLAQGDIAAAEAAIERTLAENFEPGKRLALLPAAVEISIGAGANEAAREFCRELERIGGTGSSPMLDAIVAGTRGEVDLAMGETSSALVALRRAWYLWQELKAPYEAARVRILVGNACYALGDEEAAALELEAAREVFDRLGAPTEFARLAEAGRSGSRPGDRGLTGRELEVLRLVAAGRKNREIAEQLVISEHTVARHIQNIFAKLGVSSRTAASTYAFEHRLL